MTKTLRLQRDTEKLFLAPVLRKAHPPLKGLKYEDRVRELVKFAALEAK